MANVAKDNIQTPTIKEEVEHIDESKETSKVNIILNLTFTYVLADVNTFESDWTLLITANNVPLSLFNWEEIDFWNLLNFSSDNQPKISRCYQYQEYLQIFNWQKIEVVS